MTQTLEVQSDATSIRDGEATFEYRVYNPERAVPHQTVAWVLADGTLDDFEITVHRSESLTPTDQRRVRDAVREQARADFRMFCPPPEGTRQTPQACPVCGQEFDEDDSHKDAHAPEVGWEYYECPNCDEQVRAEE